MNSNKPMSRDSFIFYRSFFETIDALPVKMQLNLYRAIAVYGITEQEIELSGIEKAIWSSFKAQLYANWNRFKNGSKGGTPLGSKNNPNGRQKNNQKTTKKQPKTNQELTKKQPRTNQKLTKNKPNVNVNVNVNVNDNYIQELSTNVSNSLSTSAKIDAGHIQNIGLVFNHYVQLYGSSLPKIRGNIQGTRKEWLVARINQYGIEAVFETFKKAAQSAFLGGDNSRGFKASFDWIIRKNNFPKVYEGNYDNTNGNRTSSTTNKEPELLANAKAAIRYFEE